MIVSSGFDMIKLILHNKVIERTMLYNWLNLNNNDVTDS